MSPAAGSAGWAAWGLVAVGGWLWGSFLNQLVDRLPPHPEGPGPGGGPHPTVFKPLRSVCHACGTTIPARDNVPILSYLWLRGRCGACGAAIGRRTLYMEILAPLVMLGIYAVAAGGALWPAWGLGSWALVGAARRAEGRPFPTGYPHVGIALAAWLAVALGVG